MLSKRYTTFVLAGAAAAGLAAAAQASLTYDLQATAIKKAGTTSVVTVSDPKNITAAVGDIVRLRLFGIVTGTDAGKPQTLQSASGSLVSGAAVGLTHGDWKNTRVSSNVTNTGTASHISNPWKGTSSSAGLSQDLDGDGDADLGSNNDAAADNFIAYRSNNLEGPKSNSPQGASDFDVAPTTTGNSTKYVLSGQVDWVVTGAGLPTALNWRIRAGQSAVWFEDATETATDISPDQDGTAFQYTYSGGTTGTVQLVGTPVLVSTGGSVPEPTMLGAVGLAGLGMLARRRKA